MKINDFQVERWLNVYENEAQYELAETDIKAFTLEELNQLVPEEDLLQILLRMKLGYNPTMGSERLRILIANLYGGNTTAKNILITTGAIEADFLLSNVFVNQGDKVIVPWPAYQALYSTAEACGAQIQFWKLSPENNFQPDLDELSFLVDHQLKLLILNIPHNPTGAVINRKQLGMILNWAEEYGFYVLCDEVYHELFLQPDSVPPYARSLSERAISVGSMSKAYGLSGLRLGWIAGSEEIIEQCWQLKDYTSISNSPISDYLAQLALIHAEKITRRNHTIIHQNHAVMEEWFKKNNRYFHYYLPDAGVLCFPELKNITVSSRQLALDLFHSKSLLVVPGECFDMPGYLRIGFGGDTDKLRSSLSVFASHLQENYP